MVLLRAGESLIRTTVNFLTEIILVFYLFCKLKVLPLTILHVLFGEVRLIRRSISSTAIIALLKTNLRNRALKNALVNIHLMYGPEGNS